MTTDDFLKQHKEFCEKMIETTARKNHDYSGFKEDVFGNFKLVENCDIASAEQGFLTRIMDKIGRINSFVKKGVLNVKDESIEDTLIDLANYSIIMACYIKDKKNQNK